MSKLFQNSLTIFSELRRFLSLSIGILQIGYECYNFKVKISRFFYQATSCFWVDSFANWTGFWSSCNFFLVHVCFKNSYRTFLLKQKYFLNDTGSWHTAFNQILEVCQILGWQPKAAALVIFELQNLSRFLLSRVIICVSGSITWKLDSLDKSYTIAFGLRSKLFFRKQYILLQLTHRVWLCRQLEAILVVVRAVWRFLRVAEGTVCRYY